MSASNSPNPNKGSLPTMPPAALSRPSEDAPRTSEDTINKPLLRNSWQSTATVRTGAPVEPVPERPSMETTSRPGTSNRQQAYQQLTTWPPAPQTESPVDVSRQSQDQRPLGPGAYGRSTSNDYTVYGGIETPTPVNPSQIASAEGNYFRHPYRRAGASSIRDTVETGSLKNGRYTPLGSGQKASKPNMNRAHWPDGYEAGHDSVRDESSPPRPPPKKRSTSVYIVREGGLGGGGGDDGGSPPPDEVLRLPFANFMAGTVRNHFVAVLGEFVGTTMFLFFAFAGTLVANIGATESSINTTTNDTVGFSPLVLMYVAVSFGFSLMVNVWVFFRVSGGLFNPAVTLGMVMTKAITYVRGFLLVCAQLCGAILASFLVQVLFPSNFNVRTTLAENTSVARGVFIEAILTAQLVFTVFMLAKEKHKATYMAPVGIGLALFVAELVGVFFTGGSLNPARSFGPCVTTGQFDAEHWIYWVGPALGAIGAFAFYRFIKILEYEMANPGQDHSAEEAEAASLREKREKEESGLV